MMDPILYKAAMEGDVETLKQQNADQLQVQVTPNNNTVLHVAAQFGQTECVKEILQKCGRSLICFANIEGETSLHISAREGYTNMVEELIKYAKELEDLESETGATKEMLMRKTNVEGDTALFGAVRNQKLDVVEILTKEDPEFLDFSNNTNETPLYLAAERNYPCILSKILKNCNSPAYVGPNGRTALHAATICYNKECIEMLHRWKPSLVKEADIYGWKPLHYAAYIGDVLKVTQLLDLDKSVAYHVIDNDDKKTALHIAAGEGHIDVMEELLSYCPDCWEMTNNKGQNILHIAAKNKQDEIINFILKESFFSSLINKKDIDGNTPLHMFADKSNYKMYNQLIQHPRVDGRACNKQNLTTLEVVFGDMSPVEVSVVGCRNRFNLHNGKHKYLSGNNPFAILGTKTAKHNLVLATLVATVTFTAGFTIPGGYNDNDGPNQGMAILTRRASFKAFVVADAIALMLSIFAVFMHIFASTYEDEDLRANGHGVALVVIFYAMVAMVVAFITGLYAVLANSMTLAISVCSICCLICFYVVYLVSPAFDSMADRHDGRIATSRFIGIETPKASMFTLVQQIIREYSQKWLIPVRNYRLE